MVKPHDPTSEEDGEPSTTSSSRSSPEELFHPPLIHENSRSYANQSYYMPCDLSEATRLSLAHQIYTHLLDGALTTAPFPPRSSRRSSLTPAHIFPRYRALDLGAGPGDWAIDMAEQHPDIRVYGVDLSAWLLLDEPPEGRGGELPDNMIWFIDDVEPLHDSGHESGGDSSESVDFDIGIPPRDASGGGNAETANGKAKTNNCSCSGDDAEEEEEAEEEEDEDGEWEINERYDFVRLRGMRGAFHAASWPKLYRTIYKLLRPGGWFEVIDVESLIAAPSPPASSAATTPTTDTPSTSSSAASSIAAAGSPRPPPIPPMLSLLLHHLDKSAAQLDRPLTTAHLATHALQAAGFTDVAALAKSVPLGLWPAAERDRTLGKMWMVCVLEGLEAESLRLLTRTGWEAKHVGELVGAAREEVMAEAGRARGEGEAHVGWSSRVRFVRGRRPL